VAQDMTALLAHTLLARQIPAEELKNHYGRALKWLFDRRLIETQFLDPTKTHKDAPRSWVASSMGRAVFASGTCRLLPTPPGPSHPHRLDTRETALAPLPPHTHTHTHTPSHLTCCTLTRERGWSGTGLPISVAIKLYHELDQAAANLRLCDDIHLYWLLMPDNHPFRIKNWSTWHGMFPKENTTLFLAADHLKVQCRTILRRLRGGTSAPFIEANGVTKTTEEERHGRFVAAVALAQLLAPGDVQASDVVAKWGAVTEKGVSVAQLEKLQVRQPGLGGGALGSFSWVIMRPRQHTVGTI